MATRKWLGVNFNVLMAIREWLCVNGNVWMAICVHGYALYRTYLTQIIHERVFRWPTVLYWIPVPIRILSVSDRDPLLICFFLQNLHFFQFESLGRILIESMKSWLCGPKKSAFGLKSRLFGLKSQLLSWKSSLLAFTLSLRIRPPTTIRFKLNSSLGNFLLLPSFILPMTPRCVIVNQR